MTIRTIQIDDDAFNEIDRNLKYARSVLQRIHALGTKIDADYLFANTASLGLSKAITLLSAAPKSESSAPSIDASEMLARAIRFALDDRENGVIRLAGLIELRNALNRYELDSKGSDR